MGRNCYDIVQFLVILVTLICLPLIKAAPQSYLITSLPGFEGRFPSKHYSGYISIDEKDAKQLFYYFVESERNPEKDPVVLWLNGGPACSSMGGFVYEHGPFTFELASDQINGSASNKKGDLTTKLHLNPYSWSKVSNIIYLDSPVGTGFSFSKNTTDYETSDLKTASDTHNFLLKWFDLFPERIHNPFYIAGESYAGIFIPTLASNIMKGLKSGSRPIINLKGYLIGNGVIDNLLDQKFIVRFAHGKGLISNDLYKAIIHACHGSYYIGKPNISKECESNLEKFINVYHNIEVYNILQPCYYLEYDQEYDYQCYDCVVGDVPNTIDDSMKPSTSFGKFRHKMKSRLHSKTRTISHPFRKANSLTSTQVDSKIDILCREEMAGIKWLNHKAVRKAIHAAKESVSGKWEGCTSRVIYNRDVRSVIKYHKKLISSGLVRVLIYSGDQDMVVPYTGSEAKIRSLGFKIVEEWRPWHSNGQVAGFIQSYDKNLTFLTIKDAGHMVPDDKPREALDFYSRWLAGHKI